jgi:phosphatidyl-myo-inositol dimannoside synthase
MAAHESVLLIASNFPPVRGGSSAVYDNIARFSAGRVIVVAPSINYCDGMPLARWREHDRAAPYRVVRVPLLRTILNSAAPSHPMAWMRRLVADLWIRARLTYTLAGLIRRHRIGAICVGELRANNWLLSLARLVPGLRTIAYIHGDELTINDAYDRDGRQRRKALRIATQVVVVSTFAQSVARLMLDPGAHDKIVLIENGVDTERFVPLPKSQVLLDRYGLRGKFVFVSVCRLLEKKGIDNTIRAFSSVTRSFPDCVYLVVGGGPFQTRLQEIVAEHDVADKVVFAGEVSDQDLAGHYCLGDVFVMPNRKMPDGDTEGFGLVFLEANACGVPVIAGQDGGSTDAVRHAANGLVVDGHAVPAIAAAMIRLRGDDALRERLRSGGIKVAAAADWRKRVPLFLQRCTGGTATTKLPSMIERTGKIQVRRPFAERSGAGS